MSNETEKQAKDTEIYRKVIKSQNCNHTEICEVVKALFNDTIVCKPLSKHFIWYLKNKDDTYRQALDVEIRQLIFPKLIKIYNKTTKYLLENIFNDDYELVKPHYVVLSRKLILISNKLNQQAFKNSLFKELPFVLFKS
jgi:hypothetical protein